MSFQRFYAADDDKKRDVVPAYWFMVQKKRRPAQVKSGQTVKVKSALKRIEAEMLKQKVRKAC